MLKQIFLSDLKSPSSFAQQTSETDVPALSCFGSAFALCLYQIYRAKSKQSELTLKTGYLFNK